MTRLARLRDLLAVLLGIPIAISGTDVVADAEKSRTALPAGYELVWSDEFTGTSLDQSKWAPRGLGKRKGGTISARQAYLDGHGHLVIETSRKGDEYYSGMIGTQRSFSIRYGYFEVRVQL